MKKGSSLIFVMLIVAGIVTVIFGAQRLALVQFSQSVSQEDNLSAYYAAKAGIEDGLARFRYSRNTETLVGGTTPSTAERYDVTAGESKGYVQDSTAITDVADYNPNHQYYDVKIDYKKDKIENLSLAKDSTLELTGFPDSSSDYYLYFKLDFPQNSTGCFVQLQQVRDTGDGTQAYQQFTAEEPGNSTTYDSAQNGTNLVIRTNAGGTSLASQVRIRPYSCDVTATFQTVTGTNVMTPANINFDSTKTLITATGYFGSTKRTLLATVDRTSGQLISIYDFSAYAGQGNIRP